MKKFLFVFILISFSCITGLKAVEFSVKEKSIIYTNALKVLENYENVTNRIGISVVNDIGKAKSDAESFLELFVNRQVLIYNDLDPSHKLSQFYEAETYTSNIILWYPDGITINLDLVNAKVSDIMSHENNVYSIDILTKKSINGNYLNQTLNKNSEELTFRIAFTLENKTLGNFKIVGVRSTASATQVDYTQALKEVNSEEFSKDDIMKIQSELKTIINDYTNYLALTGDPQEPKEDKEFYKTSFMKLFINNDIRIYNDISPEPQTSLISVSDYLNSFIADYPNGIKNMSVNVDSLKFGKVMKAGEGSYYTYLDANKFFSGNYKGKDVFRKMFPLIFKISFSSSGKAFTDFHINSIDISSVNFYEATPGNAVSKKPEILIRPVTRKGLIMSLSGSFGQTAIRDKNISTLTTTENQHSWKSAPLYGYIVSLGVSYYFTDNISVRTGVEANTYSSKFTLSGKFTDNTLATDINTSKYYKIVEAGFDSTVNINYLTFPVLINYTSGLPGKLGFYAEGGLKISIPVSSTYTNKGSYKISGYYPYNPTVTQYLSLTELGFYDKQNIDETGKASIKGFNTAFYASAGVNIPLGYYSSVSIGPEILLGISDIMRDKSTYYDIFGKPYNHQPTKISNLGIRICLSYKL